MERTVGSCVGVVGRLLGATDGRAVGLLVVMAVGLKLGARVGLSVGTRVGRMVGACHTHKDTWTQMRGQNTC